MDNNLRINGDDGKGTLPVQSPLHTDWKPMHTHLYAYRNAPLETLHYPSQKLACIHAEKEDQKYLSSLQDIQHTIKAPEIHNIPLLEST